MRMMRRRLSPVGLFVYAIRDASAPHWWLLKHRPNRARGFGVSISRTNSRLISRVIGVTRDLTGRGCPQRLHRTVRTWSPAKNRPYCRCTLTHASWSGVDTRERDKCHAYLCRMSAVTFPCVASRDNRQSLSHGWSQVHCN